MKSFYFSSHGNSSKNTKVSTLEAISDEEEGCYAVFHEPQGNFIADFAVLICPSFGQEYVRSHRALRTLALQLAQAGIPVLRFDYRGTGDSSGEAFSIAHSVKDAQQALAWLENETGLTAFKVLGIRLGATIAVSAFSQSPLVTSFAFWDPVVSGQSYYDELCSAFTTSLICEGDLLWVNGYEVHADLQSELKKINADTSLTGKRLYSVGAVKTNAYLQWIQTIKPLLLSLKEEFLLEAEKQGEWGSMNAIGGFINPLQIVKSLATELKTS